MLSTVERRRSRRIFFDQAVEIATEGKRKTSLIGRDLSMDGASFYLDDQTPFNTDTLRMDFMPPSKFIDDIFDSRCDVKGRVIDIRTDYRTSRKYAAVRFDKDLHALTQKIYKGKRLKAFMAIPLLLLGIAWLKIANVHYYWYNPIFNIYSLTVSLYILSRFVIALFYRTPRFANFFPTVSFIIPVKNDEEIISKTITACFTADYQKDKLEVIVINDGSTDNTWREILKIKETFPQMTVINFPENQGKRAAMAAGAKAARGEIIAYIDSDSIIRPESLSCLVQGFADPSVGAVCGHAYIHNADENLLTKMQEVRYYIAFRVIKAAEDVFSSVTCCSGSLSAYRREYLMAFLDEWLNQTFLGQPATFGDDRSLTNYMLRDYRVLYDSRAGVETVVPSNWKKFFRQQLRWKKSWFRESFIASQFMWQKHPLAAFFFYCGIALPLISPFIVALNFLYKPIFANQAPVYYTIGYILISLFYCVYYFLKRPNRKWIYGLYFCMVYVAVLSWQTYYAIFTSGKNHWGTR